MANNPAMMTNMETFDLIIIGAGISGINSAYRFQTWAPGARYVILDARDSIGGTWDTWKYPGVRCDSNISTMSFSWHDWVFPSGLVEGRLINEYLKDAASKQQIDKRIRFRHKVLSADWFSEKQQWHLSVNHEGEQKRLAARFLVLGTGFFDYESPLEAEIPGLDRFSGRVINPQFWPSDYDYSNQRIAVVGSGATTVSLIPSLPQKAAQVTMVQRSPSYIVPWDNSPPGIYKYLPLSFANGCLRVWHMVRLYLIVLLCHRYPTSVRKDMQKATEKLLPDWIEHDIHFKPRYNPFEQRMLADPDSAFFKSLHLPNVKLVTGEIKKITDKVLEMGNGETVEADTIITAIGFRIRFGGNITIRVDGEIMPLGNRLLWNGSMLNGVPNLILMIGYADNSWTLSADDTAFILIRLLEYMKKRGVRSATPCVPNDAAMEMQSMWPTSATYVQLAEGELPVYGSKGPWKPRFNPLASWIRARWGNVTNNLEFSA